MTRRSTARCRDRLRVLALTLASERAVVSARVAGVE